MHVLHHGFMMACIFLFSARVKVQAEGAGGGSFPIAPRNPPRQVMTAWVPFKNKAVKRERKRSCPKKALPSPLFPVGKGKGVTGEKRTSSGPKRGWAPKIQDTSAQLMQTSIYLSGMLRDVVGDLKRFNLGWPPASHNSTSFLRLT